MYILDMFNRKMKLPAAGEALPGRAEPIATAAAHAVSGVPLIGPFPAGTETAVFGLGGFWAAERLFWPLPGVVATAVGFAGGATPNPTYQEVCTGQTGHAEAVRVVFDPARIVFAALVKTFFESHDPTQGMRQGSAMGTQYRSLLFVANDAQRAVADAARASYQEALAAAGHGGTITTEILDRGEFYLAEAEHQQYLARNPQAQRAAEGTGVPCPLAGEIPV
ncbi:peptide-methionine (S)-S-oxide reductase MsrA [Aureimonas glaciei]|uniref:Peptide methionine sulfoxide reductase MsrA n=1 Tax=Aureimonas glaciei TaxID=1776957 RepID=A0A916XSR9_9HYPH|nr:peptide-methionine (S)-S-oxide reductase MsrA [Aureimonas glaciei]GGD05235.1 peptide methionine sulfoxide reductase MsrA [Aureimonas glaciei]